MKKDVLRIAQTGDTVKITTTDGSVFEGTLCGNGFITKHGNSYGYEFLIKEATSQQDCTFGSVLLQETDVKSVEVVNNI